MRFFNSVYFYLYFPLIILLLVPQSAPAQTVWQYREELKNDIQFWENIFTRFGINQEVFHDAENLQIVYKVMTFDSTVSKENREKEVEKTKKQIGKALRNLAKNHRAHRELSPYQKYLLRLFGDSVSVKELRDAAKRVRSQQGMRENFYAGIKRSVVYLDYMKQLFKAEGLPEELVYLPHIESSFNPVARSHAGAAGLWQFMRSTGRRYLKINRIVDQRYDPFISSQAAVKVLKNNYRKLGDWGLALTAYNFGLAGMKRAAKKYGANYLKVRQSFSHRRFQFASRNFYPEFLAVVKIMQNIQHYFPDITLDEVPRVIRCQTLKRVNLKRLLRQLPVDGAEVKKLNRGYRRRVWNGWQWLPAGYWINLPAGCDLAAIEKLPLKIPAGHLQNVVIQPVTGKAAAFIPAGKNFSDRALSPSANAGQLNRQMNSLRPGVIEGIPLPNLLLRAKDTGMLVGNFSQQISLDSLKSELEQKLTIRGNRIVVVGKETLGHYADWLQVSIRELQRLNRLGRRRTIYQGQKIVLSFRKVSRGEFYRRRLQFHLDVLKSILRENYLAYFIEYKVNSGESVWQIAQNRFNVAAEIIQYFNFDLNINKLRPGDILKIPVFKANQSLEETL